MRVYRVNGILMVKETYVHVQRYGGGGAKEAIRWIN